MENWFEIFQHEIEQAEIARRSGNEGKARVCARRASSPLIIEYLGRQGIAAPSSNAYTLLHYLSTISNLPQPVYEIIDHLLLHVDESFSLPDQIDLIADVRRLAYILLS